MDKTKITLSPPKLFFVNGLRKSGQVPVFLKSQIFFRRGVISSLFVYSLNNNPIVFTVTFVTFLTTYLLNLLTYILLRPVVAGDKAGDKAGDR